MQTLKAKQDAARVALGTHWVMHKHSTYDAKQRLPGVCKTLREVVAAAVKAGRL